MAEKKYQKKKIQEEEGSGFGGYKEANGGGSPVGGKFGGPSGRVGWKERGEPGHRESQPRTEDGKFTYNSVNGKGLAPSSDGDRGKTVNPLLTGGENGVKISDVEEQFGKKEGSYWDKYKDKWYQKGGEIVTSDLKTRVAGKAIWQVARGSYDTVKGEFQGESSTFDTVKKGAPSKEEKAAKQKAFVTGEEAAVKDELTGGIKVKPGTIQEKTYVAPKTYTPGKTAPSMVAPAPGTTAPVAEEPVQEQAGITPKENLADKPFGTGKYNMGQAEAVKDYLKKELGDEYDEDMWDDATLEEFIDSQGGEKIFAESEANKKLKEMGFNDNESGN